MSKKTTIMSGVVAGALAFSVLGASPAMAAPTTSVASPTSSSTVLTDNDVNALSNDLEVLFEEVITYDANGVVSFNQARAEELLGAEQADEIRGQLSESQSSTLTRRGATTMGAGGEFVDCMVQNSVIGLVGGIATGAFAELIMEKRWQVLAEKLMPRLIKAGVTGGVVGVVGGLAASSVQCTVFK
ncbi:hypothetical protein [Arthrobacter rhombi]|uniref:hypothetical protein n=1 Tax=Arthrobacter rhombi TaxID=71253 RepID=UPI003FD67019